MIDYIQYTTWGWAVQGSVEAVIILIQFGFVMKVEQNYLCYSNLWVYSLKSVQPPTWYDFIAHSLGVGKCVCVKEKKMLSNQHIWNQIDCDWAWQILWGGTPAM